MWKYDVYADSAGNYRWRLWASNGKIVASSGEAFASKQNAERAATNFKAGAATWNYEVYADAASKYRWRAKAGNGQIVASSGEAFASKQGAQDAADNVKQNAGSAQDPA